MTPRSLAAALTFALTLALATPLAAQPLPQFVEQTAASGLSHSYSGGWEQIVGGGVAVFDCNGDARPELFLAGGTEPATLWRNDSAQGGPLAFTKLPTETPNAADLLNVSGAYPLDYDSDGLTDLVLLRVGEDVLLRGQGDCAFTRANETAGFAGGDAWSTAFAATWEQGQSLPTLAIGTYIDRAEEAFPWGHCTDNQLYRPEGDHYAAPLALTPSYCALSMLFTDWNASGQASLRVSNDREYYKGGQEQLWHLSPGQPPALYTEAEGWARLRIWGMGIASRDLNADGYPEYFLTSMADNKLQTLANPAPGAPPKYADVAFARGVTAHRPYTGGETKPSTAWHAQFEDVNNDGRDDLFIAKGNVWEMPDFAMHDPNNLLLQSADGSFAEVGDTAGVASVLTARGAALADLNSDGAVDLVVVNRNAPAQVWRNATPGIGNWLTVALDQPAPNRTAIGAFIEVKSGTTLQRREITLGGGHAGGILAPAHFGLGTATEAQVRVIWPDRSTTDWQTAPANQPLQISRG